MVDIIADLKELNIPVYIEGDAPSDLPEEYFTVSEDDTRDNLNADNETKEILWEFTLKWYTKDTGNVFNGLLEAIKLLKTLNQDVSIKDMYDHHLSYNNLYKGRSKKI